MTTPDVLVVGGGPGGAAAAHWLARDGADVLLVEKRRYPRSKTCGDGLTPRAVRQLLDMGFEFGDEVHRIVGLRAYAGDLVMELPWPRHTIYPDWGATLRRADLDEQVARLAVKQGARLVEGTEARAVVEDGRLVAVDLVADGATTRIEPRVVVVADGSLSRFGRSLGAHRRRDYPYGLAVRGYYRSPKSRDGFLESQLDIRDAQGRSMPGYGWVFPLGDGTLNVGVGVISTFRGWKDVNTSRVLDAYLEQLRDPWELDDEGPLEPPVGGKLPMALSVGPRAGANWVAVGDAAGAVNPFNGEGIDYAYETGRLAARYVLEELADPGGGHLRAYARALEDAYGDYHRVARAFVVAIGNPHVMRTLTRVGLRSRPLMEWVLKVMANLLEPEEVGMAERVYLAIERIVAAGPEPRVRR
ncbi:MAG TPA: geranylgeranyl reductase family protein [Actinobacteria bacterium]|nr:geranylgeranyl reductase family protein [Actinomycetota bacterium]